MAQYARPSSDVRTGIFSPSTGATLWGCIDESTPSDTDFISGGGSVDYCEVGLSSVTDPTSSSGHIVNYRIARNPTNRAITLVVRLMQGATEIASWSHVNYNGPGTFNQELSSAQADAITNYASLSLRFDVTSSHASGVAFVYWAEFEVPDAASPINITTATGEMVVAGYAPTVTISGQTKYLVTKTGYYVTHNNMLITIDSDVAGDILMLQEGIGGDYTELELTTTTTPPTFE